MKRRTLLKLAFALPFASILKPSTPRCDANAIEARLRKGELIRNESFVVRRTIDLSLNKYPESSGITGCYIKGNFENGMFVHATVSAQPSA